LVDEGLGRRGDAEEDGRGIAVALTGAGVAPLAETTPIHGLLPYRTGTDLVLV